LRTPLSNVDAAWLRMDDPTNLMVVNGVLVLGEPVPLERIRELLRDHLVQFDRFRSRVVPAPAGIGPPSWETDPEFSVDRHLVEARLPEPGDEGALQTFVSGLMSQPLPPDRPLWRFYFVPQYQGGSALITRLHHCIGDGLALVHVLLSMADGSPAVPAPPLAGDEEGEASFWDAIGATLLRTRDVALTVSGRVLREARELLANPERLARSGKDVATHLGSLARLVALPPDPKSAFKGPLAVQKTAAWSRPFELGEFKAVSRATGSTVNDILMAALAGGLRRYLLGRGQVPGTFDVRGVVPVNLRPPSEAHLLGNRFGLVFLELPLGIEDTLERLFEVRRRMRAIKESPQAAAIFEVLWAVGVAPKPFFDLVMNIFASKATAVVTNVVGPQKAISIAGVPLRQAMFWVPSAGHLGLGASLLSYAGKVWLGLQSDVGLVPDPARILAEFEAEVEALQALRREAVD
jgi:WS/DGAT/MGAT family acyltransferase